MSSLLYKIQMETVPTRKSLHFLQDYKQIISKFSKTMNLSESQLSITRAYSSVRFFNGPTANTKIIALWRSITYLQTDQTKKQYPNLNIYAILMDSPKLDFVKLLEISTTIEARIRDVAVSPNGKQFILIYQSFVERYTLQKQKTPNLLDYHLKLDAKQDYNRTMSVLDPQYRPSGDYVIGYAGNNNVSKQTRSTIRPFKLNPRTLTFQYGPDIESTCVSSDVNYYGFLKKWYISIDKNKQHLAMLGGHGINLCVWNIQTNQISINKINRPPYIQFIPSYPAMSPTGMVYGNDVPYIAQCVYYLNSTNQGYFVNFYTNRNVLQLYDYDQVTKTAKLGNVLPVSQDHKVYPSKCIDLYDINSFACFKKDQNTAYFFKYDKIKNTIHRLPNLTIGLDQKRAVNGTNPYQNQLIQDAFYYRQTGQYCHFHDLSVQCFQISTKCIPQEDSMPVYKCQQKCKSINPNNFWNPITMSCQPCRNNNCSCPSKLSYNAYYGGCALDCGRITFALNDTQYEYNTKCACQSPYQWFDKQKACRVNCTNVLYSDPTADLSKLSPDRCQCIKNFRFIKKLGGYDQIGICQLMCQNGKFGEVKNGKQYCQCGEGERWDDNTFTCVEISKLKKGMPGWSIALIIIAVLIFLAAIGFLVWRKLKSKKAKNIQMHKWGKQTQRNVKNQPSHQDQKGSNAQLKQPCEVCKKNDTQINCQGPCGHYYHFTCIKEQIDKGQALCPNCFRVFHNGIADLTFVQQKQEIHSIADSG